MPWFAVLSCGPAGASETLAEFGKARRIVQSALEEAGGRDWLAEQGGIRIDGHGHWDLAVRMQGMSWRRPEPQPLTETLAFHADGRVAYESDTFINPDAREHIRYQYGADGSMLILDLLAGAAFRESGAGLQQDAARYRRILPSELLAEALQAPGDLRYLGAIDGQHRILFAPGGIPPLTLHIGKQDRWLSAVEYLIEMPHLGDTVVRWTFSKRAGSPVPGGYAIHLGDRLLRKVDYRFSHDPGAIAAAFSTPPEIEVPPPPPVEAPASDTGGDPKRPPYRELAPGVFLAPNVRGGFHHLFVEFDDFVAVVDAPTGWYELQQLPARNWAGEVTPSSAAEKLIDIVGEAAPGKPIRYLVLTHHHSDHAGGVRPFAALGATVVGSSETLDLVRRTLARDFLLQPDRLTGRRVEADFHAVDDRFVIGGGEQRLEVIDVGANPHSEGMLVAWLPGPGILYQSDLFEPAPGRFFPNPARIPVMRWFVDWLDSSGLDPETIYAIHGTAKVTDEQLETIRALAAEAVRGAAKASRATGTLAMGHDPGAALE